MALANSRVPKMVAGDINAEVVGVRTGAAAMLRLVERYGLETFQTSVERMFDHGEAVVRSYFEQLPDGRYVGQGRDGRQRPRRRAGPVRGRARGRRLDRAARLLERAGRAGRARSTARSPRRSRRAAIAINDARRRRRVAERGPLPADRGRRAAGLDVPSARAVAVLPLRLAGDAGDGGDLRRRLEGDADGGAGLQRRRHLRARLVGRARGHRRAVGRRVAAPGRAGRLRARRRREQPDAPRRGGDALLADRGLGVEEPVAAREGRARARLRAAPASTAAASASTSSSRRARTCTSRPRSSARRPRRGASRAASPARPNGAALRAPDGSRTSSARRRA